MIVCEGAGARLPRIDLDDPEMDLDYSQRLLYRVELFTGEVEEYLAGRRVSLVTYTDEFQDSPFREWYKSWHENGVLAVKKLIVDFDGVPANPDDVISEGLDPPGGTHRPSSPGARSPQPDPGPVADAVQWNCPGS